MRPSWRYPVAMTDSRARAAMLSEYDAFLHRYDWDGVNLAELYFEAGRGMAGFHAVHPHASVRAARPGSAARYRSCRTLRSALPDLLEVPPSGPKPCHGVPGAYARPHLPGDPPHVRKTPEGARGLRGDRDRHGQPSARRSSGSTLAWICPASCDCRRNSASPCRWKIRNTAGPTDPMRYVSIGAEYAARTGIRGQAPPRSEYSVLPEAGCPDAISDIDPDRNGVLPAHPCRGSRCAAGNHLCGVQRQPAGHATPFRSICSNGEHARIRGTTTSSPRRIR